MPLTTIDRVTVIADSVLEQTLLEKFLHLGAKGYTVSDCRGKGEHGIVDNPLGGQTAQVRIEVVVQPAASQKIFDYLQRDVFNHHAVTAWIDRVEVMRTDKF